MPGNGKKYSFTKEGKELEISDLITKNTIEYVKTATLTEVNVSVLTDRDTFFFLLNKEIMF